MNSLAHSAEKDIMDLSMLNVIVVCPDSSTKIQLGTILKSAKVHSAQFVNTPEDADRLLASEDADVVLVDGDMADNKGFEYVKRLASKDKLRVGVLSSIDRFLAANEDQHSCCDFTISKPFERDDILSQLEQCADDARSDETGDLGYCRVNIADFLSGKVVQFDLYLRLSKNRYVKLAHRGENIELERLTAYRSKNVHYLYIRKQDFRTYVGFTIQIAPKLSKSDKVPQDKKVAFVRHLGELLIESAFLEGVKEQILVDAGVYVESIGSVLTEADDVFRILNSLKENADFLFSHSVAVSLYSLVLARQLGWSSPAVMFKIGTAGLLHDIGLKEIDRETLLKPRAERSPEDTRIYESHSTRGVQLLSRVPSVPAEIVQVVSEHHENCIGHGFPHGLKKDRTHPMARMVALADEFCHMVKPCSSEPPIPPRDAIMRIYCASGVLYDPVYIVALMQAFDMDIPQKLRLFYEKDNVTTRVNSSKRRAG